MPRCRTPHPAPRTPHPASRKPLDFGALPVDAVLKQLDGVAVPAGSIRHLIQLKQAAGRPQDLDDIEALRIVAQ